MRGLLIFIFGIYTSVIFAQSKAENYGGKSEKKRIFNQELYYAPNSLNQKYGGKVELEFDLDEKAYIDNIHVTRSVSKELNAEAIRLLKLMLWIPASENGITKPSHEKIIFKFNPIKYPALCDNRGYELEKPNRDFIFKVYDEDEVTKNPGFIGPSGNFQNYVKDNLEYPEAAVKTGAQGIVEIFFVVEPSGRLTNIHINQSLEANCDIVAKELILNSKWSAGNINGIAIRTLMKRKIYFSPSGNLPFITLPDQH